jgi:hypothetical protein
MKLLRISASLLALTMVSALAACGGGGGGGSTIPNPGGGNGPTPVPTNPPATSTPAPTPTPTSPPSGITVSSTILNAADGVVNGKDNGQTNGVTDAGDPGDGDTATGGTGSNSIGGLGCVLGSEQMVTTSSYHVHAFVGIMVNGTQYAIPDAIGMEQPTSDEPVTNFKCAYNIHTHGASGIIHIEDPAMSQNLGGTPAQYNLNALFGIWGQTVSALPINGVSGLPAIYLGSHISKRSCSCAQNGDDVVDQYTSSSADPSSILLTHHQAIWLIYGTPPASLPQVDFGIST